MCQDRSCAGPCRRARARGLPVPQPALTPNGPARKANSCGSPSPRIALSVPPVSSSSTSWAVAATPQPPPPTAQKRWPSPGPVERHVTSSPDPPAGTTLTCKNRPQRRFQIVLAEVRYSAPNPACCSYPEGYVLVEPLGDSREDATPDAVAYNSTLTIIRG